MMSLPIERATCSWLEWARRVGITTRWELMILKMPGTGLIAGRWPASHSSSASSSHIILLFARDLCFQRHIGESDQGRRFLKDEPGRHFREHGGKAPLGLE